MLSCFAAVSWPPEPRASVQVASSPHIPFVSRGREGLSQGSRHTNAPEANTCSYLKPKTQVPQALQLQFYPPFYLSHLSGLAISCPLLPQPLYSASLSLPSPFILMTGRSVWISAWVFPQKLPPLGASPPIHLAPACGDLPNSTKPSPGLRPPVL